ncbi:MAG: branched-chain amino acid ABC transporter permease [Clostridia bacterium]|nr:branched-chain amino acid ABC transporter permease [Clostridia bacterium]MBQ7038594.1 branched-chain amino acid ABC transporter permease [Clostridia bacterium]MBQ9861977.1 branched-chain amino acid ABC transporter permease [Clostridia bacterium]
MSTILDGLSLGAIYALIALGYTMVYGIAKMLNFAHGDIIMVGAYAIFVTLASTNLLLALVVSILLCAVTGVVVEKLAYKPLRSASPLAVLITAIGVSYFLQGTAQLIFGSKSQPITLPSLGSIQIGNFQVELRTVITLGVGALLMVGLTLFVKCTRTGRAMLAVSEDKGAAQLMGVNVNRIIMITFAIGSTLAACASFFYLLQIPSVSPTLGAMPGIKAFAAAVIGGIGSIPGAMVGGVLLGLVEKICTSIPVLNPYTTAIEFGLLIVILLVRPIGLLGVRRREKV